VRLGFRGGETTMTTTDTQARSAFDDAVAQGRLSMDASAKNWVGHYMFMGFDEETGNALFKHYDTRQYID
jgi:hypothetical protein